MISNVSFVLFRKNWKRNQAVKHVFSCTLVQVGQPWLTDYLEKVFPPSLLISDDYHIDNKILGVHCLHHIVLNVVSTFSLIVHNNCICQKCLQNKNINANADMKAECAEALSIDVTPNNVCSSLTASC